MRFHLLFLLETKEFADDDSELLAFKKKTLPPNFAERVLNLELDMEQATVEIEKVNGLIELYAVYKKLK